MRASSAKKSSLIKKVLIVVMVLITLSVAFGRFKKSMFAKAFIGSFIGSDIDFTSAYRYVSYSGKTSYIFFESGSNAVCYIPLNSESAWLSFNDGYWPSNDLNAIFYYPSNTYYMNFSFRSASDDSVLVVSITTDNSYDEPILYEKTDIELAKNILDSKTMYALSKKD